MQADNPARATSFSAVQLFEDPRRDLRDSQKGHAVEELFTAIIPTESFVLLRWVEKHIRHWFLSKLNSE
jgi:hypothetical protein